MNGKYKRLGTERDLRYCLALVMTVILSLDGPKEDNLFSKSQKTKAHYLPPNKVSTISMDERLRSFLFA
jgi:hypothetical protein